MAYTAAQKTALENALASGVLQVTYDGITTRYRSIDELQDALNTVNRTLAKAAGTATLRQVRVRSDRGY